MQNRFKKNSEKSVLLHVLWKRGVRSYLPVKELKKICRVPTTSFYRNVNHLNAIGAMNVRWKNSSPESKYTLNTYKVDEGMFMIFNYAEKKGLEKVLWGSMVTNDEGIIRAIYESDGGRATTREMRGSYGFPIRSIYRKLGYHNRLGSVVSKEIRMPGSCPDVFKEHILSDKMSALLDYASDIGMYDALMGTMASPKSRQASVGVPIQVKNSYSIWGNRCLIA